MRRLATVMAVSLGVAACGSSAPPAPNASPIVMPSGGPDAPSPGGAIRGFELTAAVNPKPLVLGSGIATEAWTFNGSVPGPELRVHEGDLVRVTLHNNLPVATTIHWHGMTVPNGEDGVAGVTQDAAAPGSTTQYNFIANTAGTYWYHPHQHSAEQEDRGLYGALVVEPRAPAAPVPQLDKVLMIDDWPLGPALVPPPAKDDAGMAAYGVNTINGRTGSAIEPLRVAPGSLVRLRLVNAGFLDHPVHVHGAAVRIVGTDGHELAGGSETTAPLPLAAAERLDVEFTAPQGIWSVHSHDGNSAAAGSRVPILAPDAPVPTSLPDTDWESGQPTVDLSAYRSNSVPTSQAPTKSFILRLNEEETKPGNHDPMSGMSGMGPGGPHGNTMFTINNKAFPETETIRVNKGDVVAITFRNEGKLEHPMHLHGHAFTVQSTDGRPWASRLLKDVVAVAPGSSVLVQFTADNPGVWMIHCHELHHAAAGMDALLAYDGAPRLANLNGSGHPVPE